MYIENPERRNKPSHVVHGYAIDFERSEAENLQSYLRHGYARFGGMWFNKPLIWWWESIEEGLGILFDSLRWEDVDVPVIVIPFVLLLSTGLLLCYLPSYLLFLIIYGVLWLAHRPRRLAQARLEISAFLDSLPVKIEREYLKNRRELKRITRIQKKGSQAYQRFQEQIATHRNRFIDQTYAERMGAMRERFEDTLRYFALLIAQIKDNIKEIEVWKAMEQAEQVLSYADRYACSAQSTQQHRHFIRQLEAMKESRSLAEEIEIFDLSEGIKRRLADLEQVREQRA